jgi:hypothetical protein
MTTPAETIKVTEADRRILAVALASLERELERNGNGGQMRESIERLKSTVSAKVPRLAAPSHIEVNQEDYLRLMTMLPSAETWRLYWEGDMDRHELVAELTFGGGGDERFDIARNLRGTGRFLELQPIDLAFCHLVEKHMHVEAWHAAQIIHDVIEIPLPWDFLPDEGVIERIERYLDSVRAPGDYPPAIHGAYVDIHHDPEMAERGFARVMMAVSGYEDEIEDARRVAERVTSTTLSAPSMTR